MDKPDGLYVIKPHQAEAFIEQLPVRKFFGVGKATEARMHAVGIQTGADLKRMSELQLQTHFGKSGRFAALEDSARTYAFALKSVGRA